MLCLWVQHCLSTAVQLVRYSKTCSFLDRAQLLAQKLIKQDSFSTRLKSFLQTLYFRHQELLDSYKISISQMTMHLFLFTYIFSFITNNTFTGLDYELHGRTA